MGASSSNGPNTETDAQEQENEPKEQLQQEIVPYYDASAQIPIDGESTTEKFFRLCGEIPTVDDAFNDAFADWHDCRSACIENIEFFADKMDKHHRNCNVSSLTGSSAGIVGASIGLVGLFTFPPVFIAGAILAGLGGATNIVTGFTEFGISKSLQKDAAKLLEEDKHHTNCMKAALETLVDKWKELAQLATSLDTEAMTLEDANFFNGQRLSSLCSMPARLLGLASGRILGEVLEGVTKSSQIVLRSVASATIGIGLLIDVGTLIVTSLDVHKGSNSEFGRKLRKLSDNLHEQLREIDDLRKVLTVQRAFLVPRISFEDDSFSDSFVRFDPDSD